LKGKNRNPIPLTLSLVDTGMIIDYNAVKQDEHDSMDRERDM